MIIRHSLTYYGSDILKASLLQIHLQLVMQSQARLNEIQLRDLLAIEVSHILTTTRPMDHMVLVSYFML